LNLNVNPEDLTGGGMGLSAPFTVEISKKWRRERTQYGAVARRHSWKSSGTDVAAKQPN
jgi:hypothetical protein